MYRKIADFQKVWAYESEQTARLFGNLTDQSLSQKITEEGRSLGFLAWHLTLTLGEMPSKVGLKIDCPPEETLLPQSAREIADTYKRAAQSLSEEIAKHWTDATLEIEDEMYGMTWTRGTTLSTLVNHQAHHRGQVTVLMRQAGVPIIGVYGPAKEEWEAMGIPPLA